MRKVIAVDFAHQAARGLVIERFVSGHLFAEESGGLPRVLRQADQRPIGLLPVMMRVSNDLHRRWNQCEFAFKRADFVLEILQSDDPREDEFLAWPVLWINVPIDLALLEIRLFQRLQIAAKR